MLKFGIFEVIWFYCEEGILVITIYQSCFFVTMEILVITIYQSYLLLSKEFGDSCLPLQL